MNNVEHFKRIATELGELYERKNKAYGNSFSDTYKKLGIISAVTRISDKYNRLCNLAKNPDIDNLDESIEDTLRDMAAYSIMAVIELENSRKVSAESSIVVPDDAPILAMVREEDKKILKGDKFICIKRVILLDGREPFQTGKVYTSDTDDCITDNQGLQPVFKHDWWHYFKRI